MQANTTCSTRWFAALIFGLGLLLCSVGFAMQSRPLPADATLGTLKLSAMPNIIIDGQAYKLSASAQIRNQQNLVVQTSALSGSDVNVLYKKSSQGQIDRIWILTDVEYQHIKNGVNPAPLMPVIKTGN